MGTQDRFIPQTYPIHISVSCNGRLIELGKANIIITGEEDGNSSMIVPVSSTIKKVTSHRKSSTPMVKIKGDDWKFGLTKDAMLRVLVSVSHPEKDRGSNSALNDSAALPTASPTESESRQHFASDNAATEVSIEMDSSSYSEQARDDEAAETDLDLTELLSEVCEIASSAQADACSKMKTDVNNGLSLCMLGAVLGSPALSCARKNGNRSTSRDTKFWDFKDGTDDDEIPDIHVDSVANLEVGDPSLEEGSALNDAFSTASLSYSYDQSDAHASDEEFFDFEDMPTMFTDIQGDDEHSCGNHSPALDGPSIKNAVDSALAWSALILLLNLPAPSDASKLLEHSKRELNDTLSTIQEEDASHYDESIDGIPSLAGTNESFDRTPKRKIRDYKYQDSLDDNELLPQIEAMANQIEKCPYCDLFCCKLCPRSSLFVE